MKKFLLCSLLLISSISWAQTFSKISFTTEKVNNEYQIYAENAELVPMSVYFQFTLENMQSTLPADKIIVIPANSKRFPVFKLSIINLKKAARYNFRSTYNFGDVTLTKFDENYIYDLPFETGKTYAIYQGYNGKISHQNQAALDFGLDVGDKIFAAREGKVVAIEEGFNTRCETIECAKFNNKIIILQPDGTFEEYLHLKQNGAEVQLGDEISKGQFIGYSGNTGWSTGPHLHFAVFLNKMKGERIYIKTKFKTSTSNAEYLEEKKKYTKSK